MPENRKPLRKAKKGTVWRIVRTLFGFYPVLMPLVVLCIIFSAAVGAIPSLFMSRIISIIENAVSGGVAFAAVSGLTGFRSSSPVRCRTT